MVEFLFTVLLPAIGTLLFPGLLLCVSIKKRKTHYLYDFLIIFLLLLIAVIVYLDYLHFYKTGITPTNKLPNNSLNDGLSDNSQWGTFSSNTTPLSDSSYYYSFRYPPGSSLDYATGPGETVAVLITGEFNMIIGSSDFIFTTRMGTQKINEIIKGLKDQGECTYSNSLCDAKSYTTYQETLSNGLTAVIVKGPNPNWNGGGRFEDYNIQFSDVDRLNLHFWFYKNSSVKGTLLQDQIISSLKYFKIK